jgi:hypothetical protein
MKSILKAADEEIAHQRAKIKESEAKNKTKQ